MFNVILIPKPTWLTLTTRGRYGGPFDHWQADIIYNVSNILRCLKDARIYVELSMRFDILQAATLQSNLQILN